MPNVNISYRNFVKKTADYVRLILDTEVRWLSKLNGLKRIMGIFDVLSDLLCDKPLMKQPTDC